MKLLVLEDKILFAGNVEDKGDTLVTEESVFPKHAIEGFQIVDVEVPNDFDRFTFKWNGTNVEKLPTDEPAATVPQRVTMRQARLALLNAGKYELVQEVIAGLPSPQKEAATIEWEFSSEVFRNKPLVNVIGPLIGLDDAGLDALFIAAAKID